MINASALRGWNHRSHEGGPCVPSALDSGVYHVAICPDSFGPLSHAHRQPVVGNDRVGAFVAALLGAGGPPHVPRLVVPVVVNPVKAVVARRASSNVAQEGLKRGTPGRMNGNTTPPVVGITDVSRIGAPRPHCAPRIVLAACGHPVGLVQAGRAVSPNTPTRSCASRRERAGWHNSRLPAVAFTRPGHAAVDVVRPGFRYKLAESLSSYVAKLHETIITYNAWSCQQGRA